MLTQPLRRARPITRPSSVVCLFSNRIVSNTPKYRQMQSRFIIDLGSCRDIVDNFTLGPPPVTEMQTFSKVKRYLENFKEGRVNPQNLLKVDDWQSALTRALHKALHPVCVSTGSHKMPHELIGNSFISQLNIPELLQLAEKSKTSEHSLTIDASRLNDETLTKIAYSYNKFHVGRIAPQHRILCVPRELRVQTPETSPEFGRVRNTHPSMDPHSLGTLIVGLNTDYTGGDLILVHGSNNWDRERLNVGSRTVAIHPDCMYSFAPVIEGARVSLVYDMQIHPESDPAINLHHAMGRGNDGKFYQGGNRRDVRVYHQASFDETKRATVVGALHTALLTQDSVVITLPHLYADSIRRDSTTHFSLREGDRELYNHLGRHFDVELVAVTLRDVSNQYTAALYSPEILAENARNPPAAVVPRSHEPTSSVVVAHKMSNEHILEYCETWYTEHDAVYIASGLKVSKKM